MTSVSSILAEFNDPKELIHAAEKTKPFKKVMSCMQ